MHVKNHETSGTRASSSDRTFKRPRNGIDTARHLRLEKDTTFMRRLLFARETLIRIRIYYVSRYIRSIRRDAFRFFPGRDVLFRLHTLRKAMRFHTEFTTSFQ